MEAPDSPYHWGPEPKEVSLIIYCVPEPCWVLGPPPWGPWSHLPCDGQGQTDLALTPLTHGQLRDLGRWLVLLSLTLYICKMG